MTIEKHEFRTIQTDMGEYEALTSAEEILQTIQFAFGIESTLMSAETGEIITGEEIARARAILDFIAKVRVIEITH